MPLKLYTEFTYWDRLPLIVPYWRMETMGESAEAMEKEVVVNVDVDVNDE